MPWSLCSKDDVISIHPVTEAELKDEWSDWVEELIRQHLGEPYLGDNQTITDEYHDGDGTYLLRVSKPPIVSVTSVSVNDVLLSADDYVVFLFYIQLRAQTFPQGILNVKISYVSGDTTPNPIVRMTAASMIAAIVNYRKRAGADSSLKWTSADQKMGEDDPNKNVGLTSHLAAIMKRMLKRSRVRIR